VSSAALHYAPPHFTVLFWFSNSNASAAFTYHRAHMGRLEIQNAWRHHEHNRMTQVSSLRPLRSSAHSA
jgi:hypothetical protein